MTALIKLDPCEEIVPSNFGGLCERSFHVRTVASLDADNTKSGEGKITPRTSEMLASCPAVLEEGENIHRLHALRAKLRAYSRP